MSRQHRRSWLTWTVSFVLGALLMLLSAITVGCGSSSRSVTVPPSSPGETFINQSIPAGVTRLPTSSIVGFQIGDRIRIDPGGTRQEDNQISGFGSLLLVSPTQFPHSAGERVIRIVATPTPLPTPSPTPSPTGSPSPSPSPTISPSPSPTPSPTGSPSPSPSPTISPSPSPTPSPTGSPSPSPFPSPSPNGFPSPAT
ncbi:hypothetical protein [Thermostichus vulcanus]|uniref:Uncharacterized protein n=1 Tax=Thermostichus vulcanus str. 'Rupite' TaxID=2813851 RepID=A0ABT0CEH1_THEVL|nr:hypothetical protein [Thermostichus vulcanus]MCJ2544168.1 hypothetical protein [Thermostichus vulcanus str. 'Rupite']